MPDYKEKTRLLIAELKIKYPDFDIKFKNEDKFMQTIGKVVGIFNRSFMTRFTTVLGYTVYFPSREWMEADWRKVFYVLAHESIHIANHAKSPIKHVLGYSFPQNLAPLALLSFLAFIHPAFLTFLVFLLALGPWPAPFRVKEEILGYGMNCKLDAWQGYKRTDYDLEQIAKNVCSWNYYNPLHPWKSMRDDLKRFTKLNDAVLPDGYEIVKRVFFINYYENL